MADENPLPTPKSKHTQEVAAVTAIVKATGLNRTQVRAGLRERAQIAQFAQAQRPAALFQPTPALPQVSRSIMALPERGKAEDAVPAVQVVPQDAGSALPTYPTTTGIYVLALEISSGGGSNLYWSPTDTCDE